MEQILQNNSLVARSTAFPETLQKIGHAVLRYGLVLMLLLGGLSKWTPAEAEGIRPWMTHSPLMSWLYSVTSVQGASIVIGVAELAIAALVAVRHWAPKLTVYGSAGAVFMFLCTLSFLVTTPNQGPDAQGFLMKDIFLMGAALWSWGEALSASKR